MSKKLNVMEHDEYIYDGLKKGCFSGSIQSQKFGKT
jgi:hypothetical protein